MTGAIREKLAGTNVGRRDGFRWRGGEITRVEGFSDAVFAFAMTLLVVSLEVPRTFHELAATMRGFLAFGVCFTLLIVIWHEHYVFFRRYGLQDSVTVWLNAALLFVMLFYVYPLKFVFNLVFSGLTGAPSVVALPGGGTEPVIEPSQVSTLFLIYGGGVIALYSLLALLYVHAYRKRGELELTPVEVFDTRSSIVAHLLAVGVGLVSVVIALTVPHPARRPGRLRVLPLRPRHGDPRGHGRQAASPVRGGGRVNRFLWICLGGAFGTGARYLMSGWALAAFGVGFPWGTFAVNVIGSFFVGFIMQVGVATPLLSPTLRMALTTGVMGGFTTYSTFNYETIRYIQDGAWRLALGNVALTLAGVPRRGFRGRRPRPLALRRLVMRVLDGEQVLMRIFIGESDRWQHQPLWMALLTRLRKEGYAGATVFRGIGGFGARSVLHTTLIERLSQDLPLVIEIVDSREHMDRLLPVLDEMVNEGLVTMETVRVLKYSPGKRPLDPAP